MGAWHRKFGSVKDHCIRSRADVLAQECGPMTSSLRYGTRATNNDVHVIFRCVIRICVLAISLPTLWSIWFKHWWHSVWHIDEINKWLLQRMCLPRRTIRSGQLLASKLISRCNNTFLLVDHKTLNLRHAHDSMISYFREGVEELSSKVRQQNIKEIALAALYALAKQEGKAVKIKLRKWPNKRSMYC